MVPFSYLSPVFQFFPIFHWTAPLCHSTSCPEYLHINLCYISIICVCVVRESGTLLSEYAHPNTTYSRPINIFRPFKRFPTTIFYTAVLLSSLVGNSNNLLCLIMSSALPSIDIYLQILSQTHSLLCKSSSQIFIFHICIAMMVLVDGWMDVWHYNIFYIPVVVMSFTVWTCEKFM